MSTQLKDKKQVIYEYIDEWNLYIFINQHRPCSIQDLSKKTNWSMAKVSRIIKRLIESNMVREEKHIFVPIDWTEYFTEDELEHLKKIEFKV